MASRGEVEAFLAEQIRERCGLLGLGDFKVTPETDVVAEGLYDSLAFVELITNSEARFDVEVDLTRYDPGEFTRVGRLAEILLEAKRIAG